jgi:hypothetical protein
MVNHQYYNTYVSIKSNTMDIKLIVIIILVLLSTILLTLYSHNPENTSKLKYNEDSRLRFYTNVEPGKGSNSYGWITNDTLINISYGSTHKICNQLVPTYILPGVYSQIRQHPLYLNDPNIVVAVATDGEKGIYLLVNNTKWKFKNYPFPPTLRNATYDYGIDETQVIYTTYAFLDNYPTTYILN